MVCGSTKRACPTSRSTRLRINWLRTTSISLLITCWVRASRSAGVMLVLDAVARAVQLALIHPGEVEHGLAQRL